VQRRAVARREQGAVAQRAAGLRAHAGLRAVLPREVGVHRRRRQERRQSGRHLAPGLPRRRGRSGRRREPDRRAGMSLGMLLALTGAGIAVVAFSTAIINLVIEEWERGSKGSALYGLALFVAAALIVAGVILSGGRCEEEVRASAGHRGGAPLVSADLPRARAAEE